MAGHDALIEQMGQIVQKKIATNTLVLPALPTVALKCLALTKQPNFALKDAAPVIEQDPLLAAQIIRIANSAAMATREPAKTILQVVTRIGLQKLRNTLIEFSARTLFESKDQRIAESARGLWEHSLAVATLARDISALGSGSEPEVAYLSGLLHDIGKPVVAALLLEAERMVSSGWSTTPWIESGAWIAVINSAHRKVGVALAEKWELPEAVVKAIRDCGDFDPTDRQGAANTVRFANAMAKAEGVYVGPVDTEDNNALVMVGRSLLGFDEDVLKRVCHGIKDRVKKLAG